LLDYHSKACSTPGCNTRGTFIHIFDPRVVTEQQRGTAKNSVSVSLSVIFFSC
jgi:hypothetical protein